MCSRSFLILLSGLLWAVTPLHAETERFPLAPATLEGPDIFAAAESTVSKAATSAGLSFVPDPRPLPPQVILTLDTAKGTVHKRKGLLFWRGDMLPDQLAPGETGTLIRKRLQRDNTWKSTRTQKNFELHSRTNLLPVARTTPQAVLPPLLIETAYRLGTVNSSVATLVLWRTLEEGSAPLGGFIALADAPSPLLEAMGAQLPPFDGLADWAIEFDALSL